MNILILDDNIYRYRAACSKWPHDAITWAQHYYDFTAAMLRGPLWDFVTLDHDLDDFAAPDKGIPPSPYPEAEVLPRILNGADAAMWLLLNSSPDLIKQVGVHSANPGGAETMMATLANAGWDPLRYFLD